MIFTILSISIIAIISCSASDVDFEDLDLDEVTAQDFSISNDHVEIPIKLFDIILGRRSYGNGKGSGSVYIRWGRTSCPSIKGTQLLYQGKVGGSFYGHHGGGANYLCVPDSPEYLQTGNVGGNSYLYGAEYEASILSGRNEYNVPCSVCFASNRGAKLMIPADVKCPKSWTVEYVGFLMSAHHGHPHNYVFECLDKEAETIAGTQANRNGALLYHVSTSCAADQFACPPFIKNRPIACVVCTK